MTTIHIFLGSSLDELCLDREEMGNYVRKLNDVYIDRGVYIKLYECEYENAAMVKGRKQEEYNEEIRQSDIFLVLFYNKAGQYTIEEFREAYKRFQSTGAPAILTCFRQGEGYAPDQSVLEFMDELDEQIGHYFKKYTHIDSVKLRLLLQIKLMKLDVPIEVEESAVTVDGKRVLTLENIPMWAENIDFQSLKKQYQACERAYLDAKAATTDPVTDPVFLRASEQWHEAKKALRELEQELFSIALKIETKNNDGTLTERQRKAYELMEQGDAEGANNILNLNEILDDAKGTKAWAQQAHEKVNQQVNEKLEQHVQEMLQKIEMLKTQVQNPSRFDQIKDIFEEAVSIEERNHLTKNAMREYLSYLHDQKDYNNAIPLAERYLKYVELDGDKIYIAVAANELKNLYADMNRMELAEQEHFRAKEIDEPLAAEHSLIDQSHLTKSHSSSDALQYKNNRMGLAKQAYRWAKKIYEYLSAEYLSAYQPDLAISGNNLGSLYINANRQESVERGHLQVKKRREQLTDTLRNGEPTTGDTDSQTLDTSDASLWNQLADEDELKVNLDRTSDTTQTYVGSLLFSKREHGALNFDREYPLGFDRGHINATDIHAQTETVAGGYWKCRICGEVFDQKTKYCPQCGTKVIVEKPPVTLDKVQFSAIAPKTFVKGDYSVIEIMMYEEAFRHVVREAIKNADDPVKETRSGILAAERKAKITIILSSPDFEIADNVESQTWEGGYLNFSFAVEVPERYMKKQILFMASVYINDIIATRLKFIVKCKTFIEQKIELTRDDVLSAFVSYASQDRNRVAMIIQGMKKARPDMDIFFDVESLRSGDNWEKALWREIDKRDVLFLCWSKYARVSKWVDAEWRYALKNKGVDSIEPVPIDPPESCPPPDELNCKHFNDKLLYIINSNGT